MLSSFVALLIVWPIAMQQAEVVSTSLIVLEPKLEVYEHMSRTVGTIYR